MPKPSPRALAHGLELHRGATSGIAPNAFLYAARQTVNLGVASLVRPNASVDFTISHLLTNSMANETYGTPTPTYSRLTRHQKDGAQVQFGLMGTFYPRNQRTNPSPGNLVSRPPARPRIGFWP